MSTLHTTHSAGIEGAGPTSSSAVAGRLRGQLARIAHVLAVRRQRNALMALDDRMLADIGIGRSQAEYEAGRPFFDAPEQRMGTWWKNRR